MFFGRDADPVVPDAKQPLSLVRLGANLHPRAVVAVILDGVADQIDEDLPKLSLVGSDVPREPSLLLELELETLFLGPEPHGWAKNGSANHQEMLLRIYYDGDLDCNGNGIPDVCDIRDGVIGRPYMGKAWYSKKA